MPYASCSGILSVEVVAEKGFEFAESGDVAEMTEVRDGRRGQDQRSMFSDSMNGYHYVVRYCKTSSTTT